MIVKTLKIESITKKTLNKSSIFKAICPNKINPSAKFCITKKCICSLKLFRNPILEIYAKIKNIIGNLLLFINFNQTN